MTAQIRQNASNARTLEGSLPGQQGTLEIISTRNSTLQDVLFFYNVTLLNPQVLGGLFIGVLLAFLFLDETVNAVNVIGIGLVASTVATLVVAAEAISDEL